MKQGDGEFTVGGLRAAMANLPDTASLMGEVVNWEGRAVDEGDVRVVVSEKFLVAGAFAVGLKTDDPGLVMRLDPLEDEE